MEQWFVEEEKDRKVGLNSDGAVETWFHGMLDKKSTSQDQWNHWAWACSLLHCVIAIQCQYFCYSISGAISREEAERLLEIKPVHSFLVRVSEKIWGYAISYKAEDRCKHYLVDISDNGYQFFGTNQLEHPSLSQLIHYHKVCLLSSANQQKPYRKLNFTYSLWNKSKDLGTQKSTFCNHQSFVPEPPCIDSRSRITPTSCWPD